MRILESKRKLLAVAGGIVAFVLLGASSCESGDTSGDEQDREFTERIQEQYGAAQPPHAYDASQARANLIAAHDAMAMGADTWTVQFVQGVGVTFQCPSVGFPIPFGANLTNPDKVVDMHETSEVIPLMEPYGLYPPKDVSATYANCVLPNGSIGIFYSEPLLTSYGFDVVCDSATQFCTIPDNAEAIVEAPRVEQGE